jgi:hypothetical protein
MASGHVNRTLKAEHMAAPTNPAKREKSSCQSGAVHTWHKTDIAVASVNVCFWRKSGLCQAFGDFIVSIRRRPPCRIWRDVADCQYG